MDAGRSHRLTPVGDRPRQGIGLIRVSQAREDMVSPDIQRAAILQAAPTYGVDIVEWVEGIDQSGSAKRSRWWPTLEEVVQKIESGERQAVVCWKFSRLGRNRVRRAVALERIEEAGGIVVSAHEPLDANTSAGRFQRDVLGAVDAMTAEMIGEQWKEAHALRIARGLPPTGRPQYGYQKRDGLYVPDPRQAPLLAEAYERHVAGEPFRQLAGWLNSLGEVNSVGSRWRSDVLTVAMDSGFAAGFLRLGRRGGATLVPGAQAPIISPDLWDRYLSRRREVARVPARLRVATFMLSGLVVCGVCGRRMALARQSGGRSANPTYRCQRRLWDTANCPGPGGIRQEAVEEAVIGWLRAELGDRERRAAARVAAQARRVTAAADVHTLTATLRQIEGQRRKLAAEWADAGIPLATMRGLMDDLTRQEGEVRAAADQAAASANGVDPSRWRGVLDGFAELTPQRQNVALRQVIGTVEIHADEPRVRPIPNW